MIKNNQIVWLSFYIILKNGVPKQNISKNPLFHFKFALSNQKTENTIRLDFCADWEYIIHFEFTQTVQKIPVKYCFFLNSQMCYMR